MQDGVVSAHFKFNTLAGSCRAQTTSSPLRGSLTGSRLKDNSKRLLRSLQQLPILYLLHTF